MQGKTRTQSILVPESLD